MMVHVIDQSRSRRLSNRKFNGTLLKALMSNMLIFLVACSGTMNGVIRGEGLRVTFQYEQGMDRDFYETTVDGENFKGQAVYADTVNGVGIGFSGGTTIPVFTSSTSNNIVAVMFGDRGSTMRCDMNYVDIFTSLGGVGVCQHSDGRVIDVMW